MKGLLALALLLAVAAGGRDALDDWIARTELPDGDYPGEDAAREKADTFCTSEFKTFVGVATKDSSLDMFYMYPLKESWATGDREVLCFAGLDKGGLKGSLKGTKK